MKIGISFGVFSSPSTPYAIISGDVEVDSIPKIGEIVNLPVSGRFFIHDNNMSVGVVRGLALDANGLVVAVVLEDFYLQSSSEAEKVALLYGECGMFVDIQ